MDKKRLGRGLDALIGDGSALAEAPLTVPVQSIAHNPFQPRKHFDPDEIANLSSSVKTHGILQPLVVRPVDGQYQLIAGERRLRAAQDAGLSEVPIHVVNFNDQQAFEAALVENIQRTDLNPIEKAQGFKEYLDRFNLNHDQLAKRLSLARSSITNLISLLELAPEVQDGVRLGQITEAHAKILKGVKRKERQVTLFKQIVAMGLSVKAAEAMVRDEKESKEPETETENAEQTPDKPLKTAHVIGLEDELRQKLVTPVEIRLRGKERGQIILAFENNDDFERLLGILRR